jgi:hypothetical protein
MILKILIHMVAELYRWNRKSLNAAVNRSTHNRDYIAILILQLNRVGNPVLLRSQATILT